MEIKQLFITSLKSLLVDKLGCLQVVLGMAVGAAGVVTLLNIRAYVYANKLFKVLYHAVCNSIISYIWRRITLWHLSSIAGGQNGNCGRYKQRLRNGKKEMLKKKKPVFHNLINEE